MHLGQEMNLELIGIIIGVIGVVIGVLGSYLFYRISIERKEPVWWVTGNNLISDFGSQWDKLKITYNDRAIKNLTVSKIVFWNEGKKTVDKEDLTEADPLRICLQSEISLLDAQILGLNNPASRCKIVSDYETGTVTIHFDYLDRSNGLVIQMIHSGTSPSQLDLKGSIRGVESIHYAMPVQQSSRFISFVFWLLSWSRGSEDRLTKIIKIISNVSAVVLICICTLFGIGFTFFPVQLSDIVFGLLCAVAGILLLVSILPRPLFPDTRLPPKALKPFLQ